MESKVYITIQGDAWDAIAYKLYGDESYTGWLMQHNLTHLDTFVFGAGVVLNAPDLLDGDTYHDAPIWRTSI